MDLESEYTELLDFFGEKNIRIEYFDNMDDLNFDDPDFLDNLTKMYSKVQVTHIPSGKVSLGMKYDTQMENVIFALNEIKKELPEN